MGQNMKLIKPHGVQTYIIHIHMSNYKSSTKCNISNQQYCKSWQQQSIHKKFLSYSIDAIFLLYTLDDFHVFIISFYNCLTLSIQLSFSFFRSLILATKVPFSSSSSLTISVISFKTSTLLAQVGLSNNLKSLHAAFDFMLNYSKTVSKNLLKLSSGSTSIIKLLTLEW